MAAGNKLPSSVFTEYKMTIFNTLFQKKAGAQGSQTKKDGIYKSQCAESDVHWQKLRVPTSIAHLNGLRADKVNRDHVKELNNVRPKQPFFFLKPSSSILPPKSGPVLAPRGVNLHYEVELALIIGKELRDLDVGDEKGALDAIEGMVIARARLTIYKILYRLCFKHRHDGS